MFCPPPKQMRSIYQHLDSIEPGTWNCLAALFKDISGSVSVSVDGSLPVSTPDSAALDAFARLRVSNPVGLFDGQHPYATDDLYWEYSITDNSGNANVAYDYDNSEVQLTVDEDDSIIMQSRRFFHYQAGKSQLVLISFVFPEDEGKNTFCSVGLAAGSTQRGVRCGRTGFGSYYVAISSASRVGSQTIYQSSWNIDQFDGTGPSGITLDFTKSQIFMIDLEWLGVGRVRVGFVVDGIPYYAHEFLNANVNDSIYMQSAHLPIQYTIEAGGKAGAGLRTLRAICASVSSEGGFEQPSGTPFSVTNGVTTRSVTPGAELPILSIRPRTTFRSHENRINIAPEGISVFSEDEPCIVRVYFGSTLTGASWNDVNTNYSGIEYDVSATAMAGGIPILTEYVSGGGNQDVGLAIRKIVHDLPIALNIAGGHPTSPFTDSLTISMQSMTAQNSDCSAQMEWIEVQ